MRAIINGRIITETGLETNKALLFDTKIISIDDSKTILSRYKGEITDIIDADGNYISPGFIDIHKHGLGGYDVMDATIESVQTISRCAVKNGTTSFLPTTMTMRRDNIYKALNNIKDVINISKQLTKPQSSTKRLTKGANVLGVHLEGPFINKKYKGAQDEEHILKPDFNLIKDYLDIIKIITIAPEEDHDLSFVEEASSHDLVLSIGHSNSAYEEALSAIEAGVTHSTHTFNAMTPLHHRNPGVVGAVLTTNITAELIADCIHVHPRLFQFLIDVKGKDKVILVSDSIRAGGMPEGLYELGGQRVVVKDGSARLEDNTLAGSILTLNEACSNIYKYTNLKIFEVVNLASLNPAILIGVDNKKGSLKPGKDADVIVFDNSFTIKSTFINGEKVF